MRVLRDENLPHDLASALTGHAVSTVQGTGWAGLQNGELLRRAADEFDAFLTMDQNIVRQQNLGSLPFGIIVIRAKSNRIRDLLPLMDEVLNALARLQPGAVTSVGAP